MLVSYNHFAAAVDRFTARHQKAFPQRILSKNIQIVACEALALLAFSYHAVSLVLKALPATLLHFTGLAPGWLRLDYLGRVHGAGLFATISQQPAILTSSAAQPACASASTAFFPDSQTALGSSLSFMGKIPVILENPFLWILSNCLFVTVTAFMMQRFAAEALTPAWGADIEKRVSQLTEQLESFREVEANVALLSEAIEVLNRKFTNYTAVYNNFTVEVQQNMNKIAEYINNNI